MQTVNERVESLINCICGDCFKCTDLSNAVYGAPSNNVFVTSLISTGGVVHDDELIDLHSQVAGHFDGRNRKHGIKEHVSTRHVLKPIQNVSHEHEAKFYMMSELSEIGGSLVVPRCYGIAYSESRKLSYLILENITAKFEAVAVLDIKLLVSTHSPGGFHVQGMRYRNGPESKFRRKDKVWGRSLSSPSEIASQAIRPWLGSADDPNFVVKSLSRHFDHLIEFLQAEGQQCVFDKCSLLLAFDSDTTSSTATSCCVCGPESCSVDIRLIDFAHVSTHSAEETGAGESWAASKSIQLQLVQQIAHLIRSIRPDLT